jgi:hypothetical protein
MALVLDGDGPITGLSSLTFPSNAGAITGLATAAIPSLSIASGALIQIVHAQNTNGYTALAGGSRNSPSSSGGYQLFNTPFTPKSATSRIVVQTSSIVIGEEENAGNIPWLAAWYDSTLIGSNSGTAHYNSFANSCQFGHYSLCHSIASWGTSTKNINVRAGMDGTSVYSASINGNSYANNATVYTYIGLIIMEIAQ